MICKIWVSKFQTGSRRQFRGRRRRWAAGRVSSLGRPAKTDLGPCVPSVPLSFPSFPLHSAFQVLAISGSLSSPNSKTASLKNLLAQVPLVRRAAEVSGIWAPGGRRRRRGGGGAPGPVSGGGGGALGVSVTAPLRPRLAAAPGMRGGGGDGDDSFSPASSGAAGGAGVRTARWRRRGGAAATWQVRGRGPLEEEDDPKMPGTAAGDLRDSEERGCAGPGPAPRTCLPGAACRVAFSPVLAGSQALLSCGIPQPTNAPTRLSPPNPSPLCGFVYKLTWPDLGPPYRHLTLVREAPTHRQPLTGGRPPLRAVSHSVLRLRAPWPLHASHQMTQAFPSH